MSYDVHMEINTGLRMATVEDVGNYTANVSPMYRKAIDGGLKALHGLTGKEATPTLRKAIEHMEDNWKDMLVLNPKNGWGDAAGALRYLRMISDACREHPKARIRIHC